MRDVVFVGLEAAHEHEDDNDEQEESETAAGGITPIAAVVPSGEAADEKHDQDD
jgi:hypothetical protein